MTTVPRRCHAHAMVGPKGHVPEVLTCSLWPGHRCPHRTADGRDFNAEQSDAEIGALVRAAYADHHDRSGDLVELESVESIKVEIGGVCGPGELLFRVEHRSKLKGGEKC